MSRLLLTLLVFAPVPLLLAADKAEPADNWPTWRGPLLTGTSPTAKPPLKWDAKTNVDWKTPIPGKLSASPVVWGDRVFVITAVDTGKKADPKDVPKPDKRFEGKKTT